MPKLTHGVIEIMPDTSLWWYGIVSIEPLVGQVPEVTGVLFDVDNHKGKRPIAAERGLPEDDPSALTKILMELNPDWFSCTWITPEEIRKAFRVKVMKKGWATVFTLMNELEEQYGERKVRLICWWT